MAGGNLSPRQKMINMIYLVLTALLALNVSKEVLNSFFEVNLSIVNTTESLDDKSKNTYNALSNFNDKDKSKPYIDLTDKIKPKTIELVSFIQKMKYNLVYSVDGEVYLGDYKIGAEDEENEQYLIEDTPFEDLKPEDKTKKIGFLKAKDDRSGSGNLFNPENVPGKAAESNIDGVGIATQLKNNILEYKFFLLETLTFAEDNRLISTDKSKPLRDEINSILNIEDDKTYGNPKSTWEVHYFYDMPAVGALTLLSKWQADIKNMEAEIVDLIAASITSSDLKLSDAMAVTIPSSNYVTSGDDFSSQIFLSAFDKTSTPKIYMGDYKIDADSNYTNISNSDPLDIVNGKGIYNIKTGGTGMKTYKGFIMIPQENEDKYYPFEGGYTVAKKSSAVSPDYMLAMFIDVDNPITVSAAGQELKDITISISQGSKKKDKSGQWTITPKRKGKLKVTVYGKNSKGAKINLGFTSFDVYPVPQPSISINGISNKTQDVKIAEILNAGILNAKKEEFLKVFQGLRYKVKSFELSVANMKKGKSVGPNGSISRLDQAKDFLNQASSGDVVTITNIYYSVNGGKSTRYKNDIIKIIK